MFAILDEFWTTYLTSLENLVKNLLTNLILIGEKIPLKVDKKIP